MGLRWVVQDADRPGGVESVVRTLNRSMAQRGIESAVESWLPSSEATAPRFGALRWFLEKWYLAVARARAARSVGRRLSEALRADPELVVVLDPGSLPVARHLRGAPRWGIHVHWSPDVILRPWRHLGGEGVPRVLAGVVWARMHCVGIANLRLLRSAPFLVTLTESHTKMLDESRSTLYQIANPVDCEPVVRRGALGAEAVVKVGYLGRLAWEKGPDVLLDALTFDDDSAGPIATLIAGSGPMDGALRRQVEATGLKNVEFLGWVEDTRSLLERMDVLVLPSRAEAVPLVLVEALAAGCRIVAADAGSGVRDLLDNGRLGAIVSQGDALALWCAIADAVDDVRYSDLSEIDERIKLVRAHAPRKVLDDWGNLLVHQRMLCWDGCN